MIHISHKILQGHLQAKFEQGLGHEVVGDLAQFLTGFVQELIGLMEALMRPQQFVFFLELTQLKADR